jgi:glucose-1-phosphate thymidylyltransferase
VKAIILAAGYATRLYPLTRTLAKPLLPVGGRPMLDYLLDRVREVDEIDTVHVVTNASTSTTTAPRARTTVSARSATSPS